MAESLDPEYDKPLFEKGVYKSPLIWNMNLPGLKQLAKWQFTETNHSKVPKSQQILDETLPIEKPDLEVLSRLPEHGIRAMWIGHASVLIQMNGTSILTDPIFSERCSMSQWFGPKRYRKPPCTIAELPNIDAVVISHNHYDHLDYNSVKELNNRFGESLHWFVPAGLKSWMQDCGCKSVQELSWWEEAKIPGKQDVTFACVPAQHWCRRGMNDHNKVLWCGWSILSPHGKFFFAGDTGYCRAFKQIGRKYGPFDLAAIPVGAYAPRWFMKNQHIDPADAVQVHEDIKAKKSLAIHWGTFNLSYEHYLEPPLKVTEEMERRNLKVDDFFALRHGQLWHSTDEDNHK